MEHRFRPWMVLFALVAFACCAQADEIVLKNGDRLTGKITAEGSKLTVETKAEGKVTVDLKDVKTFSTDEPADVVLTDGTKIRSRIGAGPPGQMLLAPVGGLLHPFPFSRLKAINPPPVRWTGSILLGGLMARGNTDSDSFNATATIGHKTDHDEFTFYGQYVFSRQRVPGDGKHDTANDLLGRIKYQYNFTPKWYGYVGVEAEHDAIAGLDLRLAPTVGGGYQWIDKPNLSFSTEAGFGYLYRQYARDGSNESAVARLAYHVKTKFNDHFSVYHDLEYLPGLDRIDNYFLNADLGIRSDITAKFYAEFKIDYRYDSKPAPGHGPNDVRYILGVGFTF